MAPRRILPLLIGALLLAGPAPAEETAQPSIMMGIPVGTTVVIRMRDDGLPGFFVDSMEPISATPETDFERRASESAHAQGATERVFAIDGGTGAPPPPPVKGVIRFTLKRIEGRPHTLLFIENGYKRGIFFRAEITNDGFPMAKGRPTSICPVMPAFRSVEHWPYAFRYLKISDIVFEEVRPGEPLACR
jgi:hypothetical protein